MGGEFEWVMQEGLWSSWGGETGLGFRWVTERALWFKWVMERGSMFEWGGETGLGFRWVMARGLWFRWMCSFILASSRRGDYGWRGAGGGKKGEGGGGAQCKDMCRGRWTVSDGGGVWS